MQRPSRLGLSIAIGRRGQATPLNGLALGVGRVFGGTPERGVCGWVGRYR